jgi:hypothetical protein
MSMRLQWLACLWLASIAFAQVAPPAPTGATGTNPEQAAPAAPAKAGAAKVGPHDTVLTVKGVCADPSKQGDDCKTEIDREEFEKLAETLQPNMNAALRQQLANAYASMLVMSAAAEKRGLDKQPAFAERMRFDRMQVLSLLLRRTLQEETAKISDSEVENYYNKNPVTYEEASFARIFVPANQIVTPTPNSKGGETKPQPKPGDGTMKKIAAELRTRAANGEDPENLQKEAFKAAGMTWAPPSTKMEMVRRSTLPAAQAVAFDLKPGEVSEPISDSNGQYIYKLLSKKLMPLESVKQEIRTMLSAERYRDAMQPYQSGNAELNEAYFGPSRTPAKPAARPRGSKPTEEGDDDPN